MQSEVKKFNFCSTNAKRVFLDFFFCKHQNLLNWLSAMEKLILLYSSPRMKWWQPEPRKHNSSSWPQLRSYNLSSVSQWELFVCFCLAWKQRETFRKAKERIISKLWLIVFGQNTRSWSKYQHSSSLLECDIEEKTQDMCGTEREWENYCIFLKKLIYLNHLHY